MLIFEPNSTKSFIRIRTEYNINNINIHNNSIFLYSGILFNKALKREKPENFG